MKFQILSLKFHLPVLNLHHEGKYTYDHVVFQILMLEMLLKPYEHYHKAP